ncbi:MAG: LPS assembly lipoprotein LptE [Verrucomicrobiota bacterium]|nr:LPS assembly lipoprotein LptE [Verrucomicrobiota bacterium]
MRTFPMLAAAASAALLLGCAGCASYHVGSSVPEDQRTIAVPVFENESGFPEIDAVVTQYVLREFQREGTFKLAALGDASFRLLGRLVKSERQPLNYDRNFGSRTSEYRYALEAEITLVEAATGRLLIEGKPVRVSTTFLTHGDMLTGMQDAAPRIARDLSRAIVDTVLAHWPPKD